MKPPKETCAMLERYLKRLSGLHSLKWWGCCYHL